MNDEGLPSDIARTNEGAERRYCTFGGKDPFPDIAPALLNSADIYDYVRATGMLFPFEPDPAKGKLKSASYEVDFLGDLHFINVSGKYDVSIIESEKTYELPKNSIAFLFTETTFRLPDYIAARFNLRISFVHAGLLLGTGPLIDPGFAGRLLIPLHNLTSDPYPIKGGEGVIWVEFTKLSNNVKWASNDRYERTGTYHGFPQDRRYQTVEEYFRRAARPNTLYPARSSIPGEIRKASDSALQAQKSASQAHKAVKRLSTLSILALAVFVVGLLALAYQVVSLIQDAGKNVNDAGKAIADYRDYQNDIDNRVRQLEKELNHLRARPRLPQKSDVPAGPEKSGPSKEGEKVQ